MAYNTLAILRDKDGRPIPQYYDPKTDSFQPMTNHIQLIKTRAKEPFSGSATVTHTFTQTMKGLVITNDGDVDLTISVLGENWTVRPGEVLDEEFGDFTQVTVTTTVPFRAYGKGEV